MDNEYKPKPRYANSNEAYRDIHAALGYEVEASLERLELAHAIKSAEKMRDIEGHTNVG